MNQDQTFSLSSLDDDILIHVFSFLSIADILALRQTSTRLLVLSKLRIIWQNALRLNVIDNGFPHPAIDGHDLDSLQLERCIRRSFQVGKFWISHPSEPRWSTEFKVGSVTAVTDVRFLSCDHSDLLVTVSKGIWSVVTCWYIGAPWGHTHGAEFHPRKVAEWCPRGVIISGLVVNTASDSEYTLAVSYNLGGKQLVDVLSLRQDDTAPEASFVRLAQFETKCRPVLLDGDLVVLSNDSTETRIVNLRTEEFAVLEGNETSSDHQFQYNRCLQVVLSSHGVFVVRARSMELFLKPTLRARSDHVTPMQPIAFHSFGWIDGVAISPQSHLPSSNSPDDAVPSYSIALRAENDDPWSSDVHSLDVYTLHPTPDYQSRSSSLDALPHYYDPILEPAEETEGRLPTPYIFPPSHHTSYPSVRGFLRCPDIHLGTCGTAIWIQARPARNVDLTHLDVHSSDAQEPHMPLHKPKESLLAAVFPGSIRAVHSESVISEPRVLCLQERDSCNWTSLDYDEARGRVALGMSDGKVTLLHL